VSNLVAVLKSNEQVEAEKPRVNNTEKLVEVKELPVLKSETQPALSIYEKINNKPYTVDYFKLNDWDLIKENDLFKKMPMINTIENYIKDEIKRLDLKDEISSYEEIIDRIKSTLNISKNEKNDSKLNRVYLYMKLMKKQRELDKKRGEILGRRNAES